MSYLKTNNSIWKLILIIVIFCLLLIGYYFAFQKIYKPVSENIQLTESDNFVNNQISFNQDVKRFISVFLNQKFSSNQEKIDFINHEYSRYLEYRAQTDKEQKLISELNQILSNVLAKSFQNNFDFLREEQQLKNIYQTL